MSIIRFACSETQKDELKSGVWDIIMEHYLNTAFPNTNVEYEREDETVYRTRMYEIMRAELCSVEDTDDGIAVDFDSTEDAGYSITSGVYGTDMGYSDQGLTYLFPVFDRIVETFGGICFEADTECSDEWVDVSNHFSYDGSVLTVDGIDVEKYKLVMKNMSPFASPEDIAEETGLSLDEVEKIIEEFC